MNGSGSGSGGGSGGDRKRSKIGGREEGGDAGVATSSGSDELEVVVKNEKEHKHDDEGISEQIATDRQDLVDFKYMMRVGT